jgi:DNA-binding NarL/FixJ family response regulator
MRRDEQATPNAAVMTRILIADDHKVFADALALLLRDTGQIDVVAIAHNGSEALDLVEKHSDIDVLVLDISMPGLDGIDVLVELRRRQSIVPVLVLSQKLSSGTIVRAMRAGAAGYLLKTTGCDELLAAITAVAAGGQYLSEETRSALIAGLTGYRSTSDGPNVTRRELEILRLVASGSTTNEIAGQLAISAMTVETHRRNLLHKLQIRNVAGLVRYAIERGLVEDGS